MSNITKISYDMTFEARILYSTLWALSDMLLTIPYYPEKAYLTPKVEAEKEQLQTSIDEWWKKAVQVTGKTFSDNARVQFDTSIIID